jgi:5-methyltetrahydrofolate--homocysteine methyltransferase
MNTTFVTMAAGAGLTSAIVNPLHPEMMSGIRAADVINATDKECANWISAYREQPVGNAGTGRRRGGRRARTAKS